MKRTNIYLEERQLEALRGAAASRGVSVAEVTRQAVDEWLERNGVELIGPDEWERRFDRLLARHEKVAGDLGLDEDAVGREVIAAVREVREARAAGRR